MNMQVLKRTRKAPTAGDVFVYRIGNGPFGIGRVIRTGLKMDSSTDITMIYVYNAFTESKSNTPSLSPRRLLIPPKLLLSNRLWTMGYFETVSHRTLSELDMLRTHCFHDPSADPVRYCDEEGRTLLRRTRPCGLYALGSYFTVDAQISIALGVQPASDASVFAGRRKR